MLLIVLRKKRAAMEALALAPGRNATAQNKNLQLLVDKDLATVLLSLAHQRKRLPKKPTQVDETVYKTEPR
jgi:hypothetical protein